MCGTLRASDAGKKAVLMGWVNKRRDHGSLLFVDLRDRSGVTQVVVNADRNAAIHEKAETLRNEYVIAAIGSVKLREVNTVNPNMPTGEVELVADDIRILNESKLPPVCTNSSAPTSPSRRNPGSNRPWGARVTAARGVARPRWPPTSRPIS